MMLAMRSMSMRVDEHITLPLDNALAPGANSSSPHVGLTSRTRCDTVRCSTNSREEEYGSQYRQHHDGHLRGDASQQRWRSRRSPKSPSPCSYRRSRAPGWEVEQTSVKSSQAARAPPNKATARHGSAATVAGRRLAGHGQKTQGRIRGDDDGVGDAHAVIRLRACQVPAHAPTHWRRRIVTPRATGLPKCAKIFGEPAETAPQRCPLLKSALRGQALSDCAPMR